LAQAAGTSFLTVLEYKTQAAPNQPAKPTAVPADAVGAVPLCEKTGRNRKKLGVGVFPPYNNGFVSGRNS
jgi:hypothetical protein